MRRSWDSPQGANIMKYMPAMCLFAAALTISCDSVDRSPSPISPRTLTAIAVSQSSISVARNERVQLQAIATYSDGSTEDVTPSAAWTTGNAAVAAVSAGMVTGSGPGRGRIDAAFSGRTASSEVIVRRNIKIASSVAVTCTDPRVNGINALRAELDDTVVQIEYVSDHIFFRARTIAFSDVKVTPGNHALDIHISRFGFGLDDRQAAAVILTYTAVPATVQLSDADTAELLASIELPTQEVQMKEEGATISWALSIPVFDQ